MEVFPIVVTSLEALGGGIRQFLVALEPVFDGIVEKLFRPKEAGIALAAD